MNFSGFLKGEDITVVKNGCILGGIISADIDEKNTVHQTKEFLSDRVVYEQTSKSYIITLEMHVAEDGFSPDSDSIDLLEIHTENKMIRFYNSKVKSTWCRIEGEKNTLLRLVLESKEREVV